MTLYAFGSAVWWTLALPLAMGVLQAQETKPVPIQSWAAPLYWQIESQDPLAKTTERAATVVTSTLVFVGIVPCRLVDTRDGSLPAPFGPPAMIGGEMRTITVFTNTRCAIPSTAQAYSVNFTVVPQGTLSYLSAWPTPNRPNPEVSILNSFDGRVVANAAVVAAGTSGSFDVFVTNNTEVIVDINGYYVTQGFGGTLTGTAAVPALAFSSANTGLYSASENTVSIATNGQNRLTVRADGDLELGGNIRQNGTLFLHNRGGSGAAPFITLFQNTGVGRLALGNIGTGGNNAALGYLALRNNITGGQNTAVGSNALAALDGFDGNTAVGANALFQHTGGWGNIALGGAAGALLTTGSYNIMIGHPGVAGDTQAIRLGITSGAGTQTRTFIAGIRGITTGLADGQAVLIDSNGQLGTISSSRRFKEDIHDMRDASDGILRLRPVIFRYKQRYTDGTKPLDYGLIAEEVAEVYPELVVKGPDGQVDTVQYHKLTTLLLNELQKQHSEIAKRNGQIAELQELNQSLEVRLSVLEKLMSGKVAVIRRAIE